MLIRHPSVHRNDCKTRRAPQERNPTYSGVLSSNPGSFCDVWNICLSRAAFSLMSVDSVFLDSHVFWDSALMLSTHLARLEFSLRETE